MITRRSIDRQNKIADKGATRRDQDCLDRRAIPKDRPLIAAGGKAAAAQFDRITGDTARGVSLERWPPLGMGDGGAQPQPERAKGAEDADQAGLSGAQVHKISFPAGGVSKTVRQ